MIRTVSTSEVLLPAEDKAVQIGGDLVEILAEIPLGNPGFESPVRVERIGTETPKDEWVFLYSALNLHARCQQSGQGRARGQKVAFWMGPVPFHRRCRHL